MPDYGQKVPFARSQEAFAQRKAVQAIELTGRSLPASVVSVVGSGIVKVKFELTNLPFTLPQITVGVMGSEYVRLPIQTGMLGLVVAFDAYLGGVTGLGGGTADLSPRPNLANLAFVPVGNKGWTAAEDPNSIILYGPDGAIIRDSQSQITLKIKPSVAEIDLPAGIPFVIRGDAVVTGGLALGGNITAADRVSVYAGNIRTSGEVTSKVGAANVSLSTHTHTQGADSHGDTEQPTQSPTGGT